MQIEEQAVVVTKYRTPDGKSHGSVEQAFHHLKMLSGERKSCTSCNGEGRVDPYGDGRVKVPCSECNGKGYLEQSIEWK